MSQFFGEEDNQAVMRCGAIMTPVFPLSVWWIMSVEYEGISRIKLTALRGEIAPSCNGRA